MGLEWEENETSAMATVGPLRISAIRWPDRVSVGVWVPVLEATISSKSLPADTSMGAAQQEAEALLRTWAEGVLAALKPPPPAPYQDERFCDHCDTDTPHECFDSGHERDSSNDWRKCLVCGWEWHGLTGEYEAP